MRLFDEKALIESYKVSGNLKARDSIIMGYLPYFSQIVSTHYNSKVANDMQGEIYLTLYNCLDSYDLESRASFGSYCYSFVLDRVRSLIKNVPYVNSKIYSVKKAKDRLTKENGVAPSYEEIQAVTGLSTQFIEQYYNYFSREIPLSKEVEDIPDEEVVFDPLSIPNGILTTTEKEYLERYLRGEKWNEIYKALKVDWNTFKGLNKSITNKLKEYYNEKGIR